MTPQASIVGVDGVGEGEAGAPDPPPHPASAIAPMREMSEMTARRIVIPFSSCRPDRPHPPDAEAQSPQSAR